MTWRVACSPACQPDFRAASADEGSELLDELFTWVDGGPPRSSSWYVRGLVIYDQPLPCGYRISYFVEDAERYVGVIRLRRTSST